MCVRERTPLKWSKCRGMNANQWDLEALKMALRENQLSKCIVIAPVSLILTASRKSEACVGSWRSEMKLKSLRCKLNKRTLTGNSDGCRLCVYFDLDDLGCVCQSQIDILQCQTPSVISITLAGKWVHVYSTSVWTFSRSRGWA